MKLALVQFTLAMVFMFIFLKGYFPFTYNEAPVINPPSELEGISLDLDKLYKPQVHRLALIIIDALRYDFITKENMPFLHANMDCLLEVKVEAPTVTLPRIKALTTGAVPQFIDIVLNLGAKAKVADSFLHRAHASGKRMVFYGDDTWLMMFPNLFERSDGTTSFFVNDFTEVDDNVTRHIDDELKNNWDMMFLHYLGLDHIGHVRGPFSPLIRPKLHEMDSVIKKIITASNSWTEDTIIMITGDHGMKDSGGHGGTTYAETHVPFIVHHNKGINCNKESHSSTGIVQQSDIANTVSALFGIAMPAISAGKVLPQLLTCSKAQLLYTLHYNSIILQRNAENLNNCQKMLAEARNLFKHAVKTSNFQNANATRAEKLFTECLQKMSDDLIESSVKQDAVLLVFAMFGTFNCFLVIYYQFTVTFKRLHTFAQLVLIISLVSSFNLTYYHDLVQLVATVLISFLTFIIFTQQLGTKLLRNVNITKVLPLTPFILHGVLLLSSSYIEEEHYIFYYFTCTVPVLIAIVNYAGAKRVTVATAMPLTVIEIIRLARGVEDCKDWLLNDENLQFLKLFHIAALVATLIVIKAMQNSSGKFKWKLPQLTTAFATIPFVCIHLHKFYFERSVTFAQVIWALIFVRFLVAAFIEQDKQSILISWMLVMAFQLRPYNTILLPAITMCSCIFKKSLSTSPMFKSINLGSSLVVIHVWLGYTFFFIQGHRNSIANIDLAPGYLGLSSYVPALVGLLTLCHSYGFQTLSLLLLFSDTTNNDNDFAKNEKSACAWKTMICYKLFILLVIYVVIYINRGHLFIWSVFAPKLLIESMHTFVLYLQMTLYCLYKMINIARS